MTNQLILRDNSTNKWLQFQEPIKILTTKKLEEVLPILQQLDGFIREKKYYIAGFMSYEASVAFDEALTTQVASDFPLLWFGLFEKAGNFEFEKKQMEQPKWNWQPNISKKSYENSIEKIHKYIQRGDTYQVNFTMRMQVPPNSLKEGFAPNGDSIFNLDEDSSIFNQNSFSSKIPCTNSPFRGSGGANATVPISIYSTIPLSPPPPNSFST